MKRLIISSNVIVHVAYRY